MSKIPGFEYRLAGISATILGPIIDFGSNDLDITICFIFLGMLLYAWGFFCKIRSEKKND